MLRLISRNPTLSPFPLYSSAICWKTSSTVMGMAQLLWRGGDVPSRARLSAGSVVVNRGAVSNGDNDDNQDFLLQPAEETVIADPVAPEAVF
jgi:hypothetical protein